MRFFYGNWLNFLIKIFGEIYIRVIKLKNLRSACLFQLRLPSIPSNKPIKKPNTPPHTTNHPRCFWIISFIIILMCSGVNSSNLLSIIFSMSSLSFSEGLRFSSIFLKEISSNSSFIFFFTGSRLFLYKIYLCSRKYLNFLRKHWQLKT